MLTVTKSCHQRPKDTVFGYIREFMKKHSFHNLPVIINYICLTFYLLIDKWNEEKIGMNMRCEKNCLIYEPHILQIQHAYLLNSICCGKYQWRFKLKKYDVNTIEIFQVGIERNVKLDYYDRTKKTLDYYCPAYAYNLHDECLKEEDIITLTLDMNVLQLNLNNDMITRIKPGSYTVCWTIETAKNVTIELFSSSPI